MTGMTKRRTTELPVGVAKGEYEALWFRLAPATRPARWDDYLQHGAVAPGDCMGGIDDPPPS